LSFMGKMGPSVPKPVEAARMNLHVIFTGI